MLRHIVISNNIASIVKEHKKEQEKVIATMGKNFEHPAKWSLHLKHENTKIEVH